MGHQPRTKIVVWSMETTKYDEEVPKVVGIFASHLVESRIYKTRETQWRIVSKAVYLDSLILKSASGCASESCQ